MKWITAVMLFAFLSAFISSDNSKTFKKLYALEGVWKMNVRYGTLCEEWKKVDGDYLQSSGYIIRTKDTIVNETVSLKNTKEGIFYTSTVAAQHDKQPIAFKMTKSENNSFVFENAEHDFPKRIVYELVSVDSLHAYIDDGIDGSSHVQHFYYKRSR